MCSYEKKEWTTPRLVIIGEGRMEENVLAGCKSHSQPSGVTSTATKTNCNDLGGNCGACQSNGGNIS